MKLILFSDDDCPSWLYGLHQKCSEGGWGEVIHRSIVKGQNPYCLYKGFELAVKAMGLVEGRDRAWPPSSSQLFKTPKQSPYSWLCQIWQRRGEYTFSVKWQELIWQISACKHGGRGGLGQCLGTNRPPWKVDHEAGSAILGKQSMGTKVASVPATNKKIWFPILSEDISPLIRRLN